VSTTGVVPTGGFFSINMDASVAVEGEAEEEIRWQGQLLRTTANAPENGRQTNVRGGTQHPDYQILRYKARIKDVEKIKDEERAAPRYTS
jgi:hypothetical protein